MLPAQATLVRRVAIVGAGRLGNALAAALRDAGLQVDGPAGPRRDRARGRRRRPALRARRADRRRGARARPRAPGLLVGHCSAATTLAPLAAHEAFSLHPLMTVPERGATFAGATAAIAGATPRALRAAEQLALALRDAPGPRRRRGPRRLPRRRLRRVELPRHDRRRRRAPGRDRRASTASRSPSSCARPSTTGPRSAHAEALTGPIARGDEQTVARQRAAVAERAPEELELFDALAEATRRLAARRLADPRAAARRPRPRTTAPRAPRATPPPLTTLRTVADLRATLAPASAPAARSGSCRRWAPCTRATSASSAAPARPATSSSSRSSSTRPSSTTPPTSAPTRATKPATRASPQTRAPTSSSPRRPARSTRRASRRRSASRGSRSRSRASRAARSTSPASRPS